MQTGGVNFHLAEQDRVVFECFAGGRALVALFEPSELQRVMLAAGADVVGEEVVVSDLVPLLGRVSEPADILDELAVVVDEHIVDGDHSLRAVACVGRFLQPLQPAFVQRRDVPLCGEEAVQARLVGGLSKFAVDARHALAFRTQALRHLC